MKDSLKIVNIMLVGLVVVAFVYPFLHESGHSLVSLATGARVLEFNIIPVPNVMCDVRHLSNEQQVLIGAGGLFLPIAVCIAIKAKGFWMWYGNLILIISNLLAVIISVIAIILYQFGLPVKNEDITTMIDIAPQYKTIYLCCLLGLLALLLTFLLRQKPLKLLKEYLER